MKSEKTIKRWRTKQKCRGSKRAGERKTMRQEQSYEKASNGSGKKRKGLFREREVMSMCMGQEQVLAKERLRRVAERISVRIVCHRSGNDMERFLFERNFIKKFCTFRLKSSA